MSENKKRYQIKVPVYVSEKMERDNNGAIFPTSSETLIDAAQRFIKNMKDITNQAIYAIGISGCSTLLYCIFKNINSTAFVHILGLSVFIAVLFVCICLYKLCRWYYKK